MGVAAAQQLAGVDARAVGLADALAEDVRGLLRAVAVRHAQAFHRVEGHAHGMLLVMGEQVVDQRDVLVGGQDGALQVGVLRQQLGQVQVVDELGDREVGQQPRVGMAQRKKLVVRQHLAFGHQPGLHFHAVEPGLPLQAIAAVDLRRHGLPEPAEDVRGRACQRVAFQQRDVAVAAHRVPAQRHVVDGQDEARHARGQEDAVGRADRKQQAIPHRKVQAQEFQPRRFVRKRQELAAPGGIALVDHRVVGVDLRGHAAEHLRDMEAHFGKDDAVGVVHGGVPVVLGWAVGQETGARGSADAPAAPAPEAADETGGTGRMGKTRLSVDDGG
ncbi:hypothetical protein D9M72_414990 [compost metagenome]